ncbi:hypothetical protein [Anaerotalea alkaliphila]|uniref:Cellulose biosynthesis protein BcsQ n=1 Tax=Anaerotalea alkaliphila TaxID=2662126 RepID=A0A7X5KM61_9FIRM|nr:hypothetical protein [Anaerotalea alkaliphila]NDL66378.1 hypothetical protein [Anaerotalea alkaliphila]
MQIAFWSRVGGQGGTTSAAAAHGAMLALAHPVKVLLAQVQGETLERCFFSRRDAQPGPGSYGGYVEGGMEALLRLARNNRLGTGDFADYTVPLLKQGKLDLLQGHGSLDAQGLALLPQVLETAGRCYDLVVLDFPNGRGHPGGELLERADLLVFCLNQNIHVLEGHVKEVLLEKRPAPKDHLCHINFYRKELKASEGNLRRQLLEKELLRLPYDPGFQDACNQGGLLEFLIRHVDRPSGEKGHPFLESLKRNTTLLMDRMERGGGRWIQD